MSTEGQAHDADLFVSLQSSDAGYGLWARLGPSSEERARDALAALWSHVDLDGPYARRDVEPSAQAPAHPREGISTPLYGVATLPGGARVACYSLVLTSSAGELGADTDLLFEVPFGSLEAASPQARSVYRGEPEADRAWRQPLDEWLAGVGRAVYERTPFRAAVVGFDVLGVGVLDDGRLRRMERGRIPTTRAMGLLIPDRRGLGWYPATRYGWRGPPWRRAAKALRTVTILLLPARLARVLFQRDPRST